MMGPVGSRLTEWLWGRFGLTCDYGRVAIATTASGGCQRWIIGSSFGQRLLDLRHGPYLVSDLPKALARS
jgi:hypothetical protein